MKEKNKQHKKRDAAKMLSSRVNGVSVQTKEQNEGTVNYKKQDNFYNIDGDSEIPVASVSGRKISIGNNDATMYVVT